MAASSHVPAVYDAEDQSINQSFIAHNTENKSKCYATRYEPDRKA